MTVLEGYLALAFGLIVGLWVVAVIGAWRADTHASRIRSLEGRVSRLEEDADEPVDAGWWRKHTRDDGRFRPSGRP